MKTIELTKPDLFKVETSNSAQLTTRKPWLILFSRIVLFFCVQSLFALGFYLSGSERAWLDSAAWWPFTVGITNLIVLGLLIRLFRTEGKRFWDIYHIEKEHVKRDLLVLFGFLVLTFPIAMFPGMLLSRWLFGDPETTLDLIIRPLPLWAAYSAIVLFPVTQGLAELPAYFGYVMPRLEAKGIHPWLAITLTAIILGLQHLAVPFLFDARYIVYRGLMFIPFAFLAGIGLHWRPRLMPFLAVVHVLMDASFVAMLINVAY
jgi:hypothetical protein